MHGDALNWVRAHLSGPDALLPRIRALFGSSRSGVDPEQNPAQIIDACLQERVTVHGVAKQAPVIAHDFAQQVAMVCFQCLCEQAAAVERMLTQHPLTPTVNSRNSGFIHPLRGNVEPTCAPWPLLGRKLISQLRNQSIRGLDLVTEKPRSFSKTGADTVTQFFGGSIGEGDRKSVV